MVPTNCSGKDVDFEVFEVVGGGRSSERQRGEGSVAGWSVGRVRMGMRGEGYGREGGEWGRFWGVVASEGTE